MDTSISTALNKLGPSGIAQAILAMYDSGISLYVHGAPGISKSSVARQVADRLGVAFIDLRLSQLAPEDVRGVPERGEIDHMKGLLWSPPLVFPRDLDYEGLDTIDDTGLRSFRFFNPIGNNGVPYCQEPAIDVTALNATRQVRVDQTTNGFTVYLTDRDDQPVSGMVRWSVKGQARAILALEEFNSATPAVMAAAYQLVLDRRIGDYIVPARVMILALGNRDSDRGVTHQIPKPLANRFVHLEMEFHWADWFDWATQNEIHPDVLGYLSKWQTKVNDFDPDSPHLSFATPRSWEYVSRMITNPILSADILRALICGAIGDAIGAEFVQHRKFMEDMPNVRDILEGKVTTFRASNPRFEVQISYSVCVQMCYELKRRHQAILSRYHRSPVDLLKTPEKQQWFAEADRGFGYAIDHFKPEVVVMAARLAMGVHGLSMTQSRLLPRFTRFLSEHADILTSTSRR